MMYRQAIQLSLAYMVAFLSTGTTFAQTPVPTTTGTPNTVQIIPVSLANTAVAASVNNEKIYVGDVKKILDQKPYPNTLTEDQKKQLRLAALDVLIEDAVMRQYLGKQGYKVTQPEFDKEWTKLLDGLKKEGKAFEQFLRETGQTQEIVQRDIIARLQWKSLLNAYYPEDKLKQYYEANKPHFDQVLVKASHILIKVPPTATKEQRQAATEQLRIWRQDILAGKVKFEDVAKQYSQCPTKDKGGDIGEFTLKFVVVPEFARTAFSMQKGQISDVVQTVFGVHLILVTDRTKGMPSDFATMRETVREVYAQDEDLYQRILAQERKNGDIKIHLP